MSAQPLTQLTSEEYLAIERVEKFRRQSGEWVFSESTSMEQVMYFDSVGCSVPLAEIYSNATFSVEENVLPS